MTDILVTGATGTTGGAVLAELTAQGVRAKALVRDAAKGAGIAGDLVEPVVGDLADRASLEAAFAGIARLYLVTAVTRDAPQQVENAFAAAKAADVKHIVKLSGLNATADSGSELIRRHAAADAELKASGLGYTILQPNSFCQNMFWQAEAIKAQGQFYLPIGEARQSLIDVRDAGAVAAKALTSDALDGQVLPLTGPESLTYHDVAAALSEATGRPVTYVPVPNEAARQSLLDAGAPAWDADMLAEFMAVFASGSYAYTTDAFETAMGRPPRRFADFARDFAAAFTASAAASG